MPMTIHRKLEWLVLAILVLNGAGPAVSAGSAQEKDTTWNRALPIGAKWALQQGIDLPNPFGIGVFLVTMTRDIEVYDVRVKLPGDEPVSISNVASFDVRNHTTLGAVKVDAWILPLLNLYALAGHTWTDTRLNVAVTIDRIIGDPLVINATQDSDVGGPLFGVGATAVAGYGHWFIMADANYVYSDIEELGGIGAWFISARTGWSGPIRWGSWRAWAGAAYLAADRTLSVSEESPILGTVQVEVDQRPVNPMTLQAGGSIGIGKRWELMLEAGSNFDDAFVGVFSASFRF
ncbi:MAG: hypothetical protein H6Q30_383 [Bacteroidetes bacterium]|nr:hypothetical protein [Bacteroidota bacterium]